MKLIINNNGNIESPLIYFAILMVVKYSLSPHLQEYPFQVDIYEMLVRRLCVFNKTKKSDKSNKKT